MDDEFENGSDDETDEQSRSSRADHLKPFQFKKGQSGNPNGRPAGKTLKEYTRDMLAAMTDEERMDFLNGIDKKTLWEMAEGKPKQEQEVAGKNGEPIQFVIDQATQQRFNNGNNTPPKTT